MCYKRLMLCNVSIGKQQKFLEVKSLNIVCWDTYGKALSAEMYFSEACVSVVFTVQPCMHISMIGGGVIKQWLNATVAAVEKLYRLLPSICT